MENLTGRQFGPYQIVAPLGEGGMATVYKAYQPAMDRYVALKVLPQYYARDPEFMGRFRQEARVVANLQHPHILPVHDFGECDGYTFMVMPFIESGTLGDTLKGEPFPLSRIQQVIGQVGDALDYAHSQGVIHRDIKPSNILLDHRGNCLLTDFGVAKIVEGTVQYTQTGGIVGTPAYMSPEQIRGEALDGRSDIYSLGIVLFEMATGRAPYRAETPPAILVKHLHDPLPPPRSFLPNLPESVERVILKCLAKDRTHRYRTAGEMVAALSAAIAQRPTARTPVESIATSPPPATVVVPARKKRRRPAALVALLGLIGVAGLAAIVAGGIYLGQALGEGRAEATPSLEASILITPETVPTETPVGAETPTPDELSAAAHTWMTLDEVLSARLPRGALYHRELAVPLGEPIEWPGSVAHPVTGDPVGHLRLTGHALGEQSAQVSLDLTVPAGADLISVPLATALNGSVERTDSEAGIELAVRDRETERTTTTYATNVLETTLGAPFLLAFADVSPFRERSVTLQVTLLHPDVCAGALCTHDIDLYLGPVQFQQLPDVCVIGPDGQTRQYDYLNDPSPELVEDCGTEAPFRLIEAVEHAAIPFHSYGSGRDIYQVTMSVPRDAVLIDFALYYGPRLASLRINGQVISSDAIQAAFPIAWATYNRVAQSARYSFANNSPDAVAPFFYPGENTINVVIAADHPWQERPFSLYARFVARQAP